MIFPPPSAPANAENFFRNPGAKVASVFRRPAAIVSGLSLLYLLGFLIGDFLRPWQVFQFDFVQYGMPESSIDGILGPPESPGHKVSIITEGRSKLWSAPNGRLIVVVFDPTDKVVGKRFYAGKADWRPTVFLEKGLSGLQARRYERWMGRS
jgi:hypothetical protein